MAEVFLMVQNLHKSFNEHRAVKGVSFTISKGEVVLGDDDGCCYLQSFLVGVPRPDRPSDCLCYEYPNAA